MIQTENKLRGLFINPPKANCSIYESGLMIYNCLILSDKYKIDYIEVDKTRRSIPDSYDFYAFNYHYNTMGWLDTKFVSKLPGLKLTFILEVSPNDPFILCPSEDFDVYCVLDPTINVADKRVYAFPRPLEVPIEVTSYHERSVPVIGTFGFATPGKGFELVVDAVNKEFDEAFVRINLPTGTYADGATWALHKQNYADYLADLCKKTAKKGINVEVTRDYMSKEELIKWCSQNTLNCFFYNRNQPGLSATTDQAITSSRPLSISVNNTFRHIISYIKPYPYRSLKESIVLSKQEVLQIQKDWAPDKFIARFEQVLAENVTYFISPKTSLIINEIELRIKKQSINLIKYVPTIIRRPARKILSFIGMKKNENVNREIPSLECTVLRSYIRSYSQYNEDIIIDFLFESKESGFYLDIGANDPSLNNNTKHFYDKGWKGINIEPELDAFNKICLNRKHDVNLNIGIGPKKGTLTFYQVVGDSTLSSFKKEVAYKMANKFGLKINKVKIDVQQLVDIFDNYIKNRRVDFMSIDAEGLDLEILKSNDWTRYRPSLILVEIDSQYQEIVKYMKECYYLLIYNNYHNGIFIDMFSSDKTLNYIVKNHELLI